MQSLLPSPSRGAECLPYPPHNQTAHKQAYYCCIIQLLSSWESNTTATVASASGAEEEKGAPAAMEEGGAAKEVVYVCGDSHTLTPAWHEVTVGGK